MTLKNNKKFFDSRYLLEECDNNNIDKLKVAIHIHIYYIDMLDTFISYLKDCPIKFDLLISITEESHRDICINKINNICNIKVVQNKGRDIASFLIDFKKEIFNYDLVCHIHSKKSLHANNEVDMWAEYLFDSLISSKAIKSIISNFIIDDRLGIVFPPAFYDVYEYACYLHDRDKNNMNYLLEKMNINFDPNSDNFIFPAGNMFWVRPIAIKNIFDLNLGYNDLPDEPIDNAYTILHSIERVFAIIAEYNNYRAKFYVLRKYLVEPFFQKYQFLEKIKLLEERFFNIIEMRFCKFHLLSIKKSEKYIKIIFLGIKFIIRCKI